MVKLALLHDFNYGYFLFWLNCVVNELNLSAFSPFFIKAGISTY